MKLKCEDVTEALECVDWQKSSMMKLGGVSGVQVFVLLDMA
jgi:hypothetical protein